MLIVDNTSNVGYKCMAWAKDLMKERRFTDKRGPEGRGGGDFTATGETTAGLLWSARSRRDHVEMSGERLVVWLE